MSDHNTPDQGSSAEEIQSGFNGYIAKLNVSEEMADKLRSLMHENVLGLICMADAAPDAFYNYSSISIK